jgi:hypothetical protein
MQQPCYAMVTVTLSVSYVNVRNTGVLKKTKAAFKAAPVKTYVNFCLSEFCPAFVPCCIRARWRNCTTEGYHCKTRCEFWICKAGS